MKKVRKSTECARSSRKARRALDRARHKIAKRSRFASAAAALAIALGLCTASARADTFTVGTLDDSGAGSLRQAILDANAAAGLDLVTFQSALTGKITLTTGQLSVTDSVELQGPGAESLTVSGGGTSRVFELNGAAEIDVSISGLTISDGAASNGAGIVVYDENLILDDVVVENNHATGNGGGIWLDGFNMDVLVMNSRISGNTSGDDGGGIYVEDTGGPFVLDHSKIDGNSAAGSGGGIYFYDPDHEVSIDTCSISGNTANGVGGGVYFYHIDSNDPLTVRNTTIAENVAQRGGGIFVDDVDVIFESSTIAANEASAGEGGGVYLNEGSLTFNHATVALNVASGDGQGVASDAPVVLNHTLISDNGAANDAKPDISGGDTFELHFSLVEDATGATITDVEGNVLGSSAKLGSLKNTGGFGATLIPAGDSPAVNAGNSALSPAPDFDQRGMPRVFDEVIDIGAVERSPGILALELATTSVAEAAGTLGLKVTRTAGADGDMSVDYATSAATATSPEDFTVATGALSLAEGEKEKTITITVVDDERVDAAETFSLALSNITGGATLSTPSQTIVTIDDDDAAPTISAIDDLSIMEDQSTSALAFTVTDADTDLATLTVTGVSSNTALVANAAIVFGGTGGSRTTTLTPLADQFGTTDITLTVSDGFNSATEVFTLTVTDVDDGGGSTGGDTSGGTTTGGSTTGSTSGGETSGGENTSGGDTGGAANNNGGANVGSGNAGNGNNNAGDDDAGVDDAGVDVDSGTDEGGGASGGGCSVSSSETSSSNFSFGSLLGLMGLMAWRRKRDKR